MPSTSVFVHAYSDEFRNKMPARKAPAGEKNAFHRFGRHPKDRVQRVRSFSLSAIPTGIHDVTINAASFRPYEATSIHLDAGDVRAVRDIKLLPGVATDTVEVHSAAGTINLDSGEQSSLISAEDIPRLSVQGRDATELLKILPGFAISRGGAGSFDKSSYDPSQV